jgi:hypothetical protein
MLAMVTGIEPRDQVEAMLAVIGPRLVVRFEC